MIFLIHSKCKSKMYFSLCILSVIIKESIQFVEYLNTVQQIRNQLHQNNSWGCKVTYVDLHDFVEEQDPIKRNCDQNFTLNYVHDELNQGLKLSNQEMQSQNAQWSWQDGQGLILKKFIDQYPKIDPNDADLIFVFDFCIKYEHGQLQNQDYNIEKLKKGYDTLIQTPRWQKFNGKDHLFVMAHPVELWMDQKIKFYFCNKFVQSLYIQIENFQQCHYHYPYYDNYLSIPYVSTIVPQKYVPLSERTTFIYFLGECSSNIEYQPIGKKLRKSVIESIQQNSQNKNISVTCACKSCDNRVDYQQMMYDMQRSIFCLVLPGDSISSRRLSDVVMAGCIPVFVGPPYHTTPFQEYANYNRFSVFFHVINATWMDDIRLTEFSTPEADTYRVWGASQILPVLERILKQEQKNRQKLREMSKIRSLFEYYPNPHGGPSAVDIIFGHMCQVVKARRQFPDKEHLINKFQ